MSRTESEPATPGKRTGTGYAKSQDTRERILGAAIDVFGERGFAMASTREIASRAGVVPPALQYHFGGKEALHRACGEAVVNDMLKTLRLPLDTAHDAAANGDKVDVVEALCGLLEAVVLTTAGPETSSRMKRFFSFAQLDASQPAFTTIRERMLGPVFAAGQHLVARAIGLHHEDAKVRAMALLLLGQARALTLHRRFNMFMAADGVTDDDWSEAASWALRRCVLGALAEPA